MSDEAYILLEHALEAVPDDLRRRVLSLSYATLGVVLDVLVKTAGDPTSDRLEFIKYALEVDEAQHDISTAEAVAWEADECYRAGDPLTGFVLAGEGLLLVNRHLGHIPDDRVGTGAKQVEALCHGVAGMCCRVGQAHDEAERHLVAALHAFRSLGDGEREHFLQEELNGLRQTRVSPRPAMSEESQMSVSDLISAAQDAILHGKLFHLAQLTPCILTGLRSLPLDECIRQARALISFQPPEWQERLTKRLYYQIERNPQEEILRHPAQVWLYYVLAAHTYIVFRAGHQYLFVRLVEMVARQEERLKIKAGLRMRFYQQYDSALANALADGKNMYALRFADSTKARVTVDLLGSRRGQVHDAVDLTRVQSLDPQELATGSSQLRSSSRQRENPRGKGMDTLARMVAAIETFESHGLGPFLRKDPGKEDPASLALSINAMRKSLDEGSLVLEYAKAQGRLHAWAIPFSTKDASDTDLPAWASSVTELADLLGKHGLTIDEAVVSWTNVISAGPVSGRPFPRVQKACLLLYRLVIGLMRRTYNEAECEPLAQLLEGHYRLIIVPTGALARIPWNALLGPNGWLWRSHLVNLLPSITLQCIGGFRWQARMRPIESVLLAGDPAGNLPAADHECRSIARMLEREHVTHRLLTGKEVRSANLCNELAKYDVIHLACHAKQQPGEPASSFLAFAEGETVTAVDLLSWDLRGKAVILSCCESGKGEVDWNDEGFSLAQACLMAGAKYVVASLWRVDDRATAELFVRFYQHLLLGQSPQFALNLALREFYTHNADKRDPFFWAPFQVFGNPSVLDACSALRMVKYTKERTKADVVLIADPLAEERAFIRKIRKAGGRGTAAGTSSGDSCG